MGGNDHFYSLEKDDQAKLTSGYRYEKVEALVFSEPQPSFYTNAVYSYYSQGEDDHYLTVDAPGQFAAVKAEERGYKIQNEGKPVFYVHSRDIGNDTIPLYQWYHDKNHFYTVHETGEQASWDGGKLQGVLGYVYPANAERLGDRKELHRYYKS